MKDLALLLPEILLSLTLIFVLIGELTYYGEEVRLISATALMGLAGAFIQTLMTYQHAPERIFQGAISIDGFSLFFKLIFIVLAALTVISVQLSNEIPKSRRSEFYALILASALGMCVAASSEDLLLTFLALQLVNILGHFLAAYSKQSILSSEAGVKHMVFGVASGGLLLFGIGLLFASAKTLNFLEIHNAFLSHPPAREIALIIFVFAGAALAYQLASFPMYFWAPDVLEGAPTATSAFLSVGSRAAGFAVALRMLLMIFSQPALEQHQWLILGNLDWTRILGLISGMTMLLGAFLAFRQDGAKRMVACFVVVATGNLLLGVLVMDATGVAALLYNVMVELFAIVGCHFVISFFQEQLASDRLRDFKGMLDRSTLECVCLILFLAALVGLPPMPGFIGRFALIQSAIDHGWPILALISVAAMALSAVTVTRLAYHLIGDLDSKPLPLANGTAALNFERKAFLMTLLLPLIMAVVFAEPILRWAGKSVSTILW